MQCGRVLEDTAFSTDVTFQKDAGGESAVVGQFVSEAGVARGVGMVVGAGLIGTVLVFLMIGMLKKAFLHAGGVPWVGAEIKEAIGFILGAVREHQDKLGR